MRSAERAALVAASLVALGGATALTAATRPQVGLVTVVKRAAVTVGNTPLQQGDRHPIRAGDLLTTDARGNAEFMLGKSKSNSMQCTIRTVATAGKVKFTASSISYLGGRVQCVTTGSRSWRPRVPGGSIRFEDPVYEVDVHKAGTVLKVQRGRIVVGSLGAAGTVVVGRDQQTTVSMHAPPTTPTKAVVSAAEAQVFDKLAGRLPPDTDTSTPAPTVEGPLDPSSIRNASFSFSSSERGVVFSCSLDASAFRVCASGDSFAIVPGRHTLTVQATDAAGNSARQQPLSWIASPIVFAAASDAGSPESDIYAIDPDGSHRVRLTDLPGQEEDPSWSPDHTRIAFHHSERRTGSDLYVMDANGGNRTLIMNDGRNPAWSPDGSKIAFESTRDGNREIYVMDVKSGGVTRLTRAAAEDFDPCWSPDGGRIAFASTRDGNAEIYTMSASDGGDLRRLTSHPAADFNPAWSRDGRTIVFHSTRREDSSELLGPYQLYEMNADGTGTPTKLSTAGGEDENPAWAPQGRAIVFQSNRDGNSDIYVMNAERQQTNVTRATGEYDFVPDW